MITPQLTSAKNASIIAMTAALYAVFFYVSSIVSLSGFTLLYLPVILLGVFPIWFGWNGLAGSMIGAFIGGALIEGYGLLGIFEVVTAIIIFLPNWVLLPKDSFKFGPKNLVLPIAVYGVSLFLGTAYILWQYSIIPMLWDLTFAETLLLPEFAVNFVIMAIICPILYRVVTPRIRSWGIYSGTFFEWQNRRRAKMYRKYF
jgi:hypothetical protein